MISPLGMDELFWGRDHENVNYWAERLIMVVEVKDSMMTSCLRLAKLNLHG